MNERLIQLLRAALEFIGPLGPLGDLDRRREAERAWVDSLTGDDVLLLLGWVADPARPPGWEGLAEGWIRTLAYEIGEYAGRAGARLGEPRIRQRLEELLAIPAARANALRGLEALGDPASFEAALTCLGDPNARHELPVTLTSLATTEQIGTLAGVLNDPNRDPVERKTVLDTLTEFRTERWAEYQTLQARFP